MLWCLLFVQLQFSCERHLSQLAAMQDIGDSLSKCLTLAAELRDFEKLSKVSSVTLLRFVVLCTCVSNCWTCSVCEYFVISQFLFVRPSSFDRVHLSSDDGLQDKTESYDVLQLCTVVSKLTVRTQLASVDVAVGFCMCLCLFFFVNFCVFVVTEWPIMCWTTAWVWGEVHRRGPLRRRLHSTKVLRAAANLWRLQQTTSSSTTYTGNLSQTSPAYRQGKW